MNRTSHLFLRYAALATAVVGLVLITAGQATARTCVDPSDASVVPCPPTDWRRMIDELDPPLSMGSARDTGNSDWTLQWMLFAAAVLGALAVVAVVCDVLARRRWRQPPLEAVLSSGDPGELPRTAGLLGDLLVQRSHPSAAEHAYRAAIDVGDQHWSPIAQLALADLLRDQGERSEAQALLEAAIASGHPRAVPAAQASLDQLLTGKSHTTTADGMPLKAYETLGDARPAHR